MVYINKGDHENPHGLPKCNSVGLQHNIQHEYAHIDVPPQMPEEVEKLEYIYQHFQEHEKVYESNSQLTTEVIQDTLYPQMSNDIEYGLFEKVIDSYYLDSQIRDDFQCIKTCYTSNTTAGSRHSNPPCTHAYDHISQQLHSLADSAQQHTLYTNEMDASLFTTDTAIQCEFNITPSDLDTEHLHDIPSHHNNNTGIHCYSKHKYIRYLW